MTLRGYTVPPDAIYEKQVKEVVHAKIKNSLAFTGFIRKYHDNIPLPPNENDDISTHAINHILNSISVKLLKIIVNGLDVAVFNVYIYPPSKNYKLHSKWISMLRNNIYTMTEGAGSPLKTPYHCNVCCGEDHPTGLCAFTRLPGWIDHSQHATNDTEDEVVVDAVAAEVPIKTLIAVVVEAVEAAGDVGDTTPTTSNLLGAIPFSLLPSPI
ncbi:hypothetical protein M422DRAFT_262025 [Sphaerobolus stellatus SS14]|uniref:Unplaced genomic scaffold SPHSTscaffold_111, whole genome shotgun sequence n=1 Tax=Sphaerobolus stellatus (strain SS14) TaxID=990650 RepID=A0A0C9V1R5_SPHS4|nr:hypothetical protein M422DRAFT_262025 [Sphaerobolus stellatus SS14]